MAELAYAEKLGLDVLKQNNEVLVMKIEATKVERCKDGYWTHPELPDMGETVSKFKLEQFENEQGFKVHIISMEYDADEETTDLYFEHGEPGCPLWEPTKPSDNAFLLSIHDTEDGPFAWWAVPKVDDHSVQND